MAMDSRTSGIIGGAGKGAAAGTSIMPGWGTAIGAVAGGIFGGLMGGGEDDAERLAEEQQKQIWSAFRENKRRMMQDMGMALGASRAAVGASNLQMSGSSQRYMDSLRNDYTQGMAWDKQEARINAKMAKLGGKAAVNQIQNAGIRGAIGGVARAGRSGAFGTYSSDGGYKAPWSK